MDSCKRPAILALLLFLGLWPAAALGQDPCAGAPGLGHRFDFEHDSDLTCPMSDERCTRDACTPAYWALEIGNASLAAGRLLLPNPSAAPESYLDLENLINTFQVGDRLTFETWLRWDGSHDLDSKTLLECSSPPPGEGDVRTPPSLKLWLDEDEKARVELHGHYGSLDGTSDVGIDRDVWKHVAFSYALHDPCDDPSQSCPSQSRIALYIDGSPAGSTSGENQSIAGFERLVECAIGKSNVGSSLPFGGELEEFRIYSRELDQEQVAASFCAGPGVVPPIAPTDPGIGEFTATPATVAPEDELTFLIQVVNVGSSSSRDLRVTLPSPSIFLTDPVLSGCDDVQAGECVLSLEPNSDTTLGVSGTVRGALNGTAVEGMSTLAVGCNVGDDEGNNTRSITTGVRALEVTAVDGRPPSPGDGADHVADGPSIRLFGVTYTGKVERVSWSLGGDHHGRG